MNSRIVNKIHRTFCTGGTGHRDRSFLEMTVYHGYFLANLRIHCHISFVPPSYGLLFSSFFVYFLNLSKAISLGTVADKTMRGVGAVSAAFKWSLRPFSCRYRTCCYKDIRIITGRFLVFLIAYQHIFPPFQKRKAGESKCISALRFPGQ